MCLHINKVIAFPRFRLATGSNWYVVSISDHKMIFFDIYQTVIHTTTAATGSRTQPSGQATSNSDINILENKNSKILPE